MRSSAPSATSPVFADPILVAVIAAYDTIRVDLSSVGIQARRQIDRERRRLRRASRSWSSSRQAETIGSRSRPSLPIPSSPLHSKPIARPQAPGLPLNSSIRRHFSSTSGLHSRRGKTSRNNHPPARIEGRGRATGRHRRRCAPSRRKL